MQVSEVLFAKIAWPSNKYSIGCGAASEPGAETGFLNDLAHV